MNEPRTDVSQKNIATHPAVEAQAQLLSVRVEAELGKPAVVMVTSAREGDGKSLTAYSLADAFAKSDHRVALVSRWSEEYHQLPVVKIRSEDTDNFSRDRLAAFVEKTRAEYDFTVIDAETFTNRRSVGLARLVDGILLAVRIGRAPTAEDEAMVAMIEQFGGRVVGVVATEANTIADFEHARRDKPASAYLRPVPNAEQNTARAFVAISAEHFLR